MLFKKTLDLKTPSRGGLKQDRQKMNTPPHQKSEPHSLPQNTLFGRPYKKKTLNPKTPSMGGLIFFKKNSESNKTL